MTVRMREVPCSLSYGRWSSLHQPPSWNTTHPPPPPSVLELAKDWLESKWSSVTSLFKKEPEVIFSVPDDGGEQYVAEAVSKQIAERVLSGQDIWNDAVNQDVAKRISAELGIKLDPVSPLQRWMT